MGGALISDFMTVVLISEDHKGIPEVVSVGPVVSWASELRGLNYGETSWKAGLFHRP